MNILTKREGIDEKIPWDCGMLDEFVRVSRDSHELAD
jgi:hypothetical protein